MTFSFGQRFRTELVDDFIRHDIAIDGTSGGLLMGPTHADGGIKVLYRFRDAYRLVLEVEGGEYWFDPGAATQYTTHFNLWNDRARDKALGYEPIYECDWSQTIDCRSPDPSFPSKFLLADSRTNLMLINKYSTARHLETLDRLNGTVPYTFWGLHHEWSEEWGRDFRQRWT